MDSVSSFVGLGTLVLLGSVGSESPLNLASPLAGTIITGPQNASGSAGKPLAVNDGEVTEYGRNHGYAWGWFEEPLVMSFAREQRVNKVEVLMLDVDGRQYSFGLEAEVEGQWRKLTTREGVHGWVTLIFAPVQCTALRFVFTGNTLDVKAYHVVEAAVYDDPTPVRESTLKQKWLAWRCTRDLADLKLLGVDEALERVFLDETAFRRAKALAEGEKRWLDADGDRDPDLIVFRDEGTVIVALDDDDDATSNRPEADRDSDCWVIDLDLDGRPDRVLDYWDDDGDGDVDREHHYYLHFGWFGARPGLVVVWDYNDDNRTWKLQRFSYHQDQCQWDCDFGAGGEEGFSLFTYDSRTRSWEAHWECPFYFYDPDRDGRSEEAVRLEGYGRKMRALRYSMNADDDESEGQPYDYDFGIIALGPVELPEAWLIRERLRSSETGLCLPYGTARERVCKLSWSKALLVWDENDCNIDPHDTARHERWEGIINAPYAGFPQIGGPSCGHANKRYEIDADNSGKLRLYACPIDGRLHLYGAERGTLFIDADNDGKVERRVEYEDTDGDGFFDRWLYDDDGNGQPERTYDRGQAYVAETVLRPLNWRELTGTYVALLKEAIAGHRSVAKALGLPLLTSAPENGKLEIQRWLLEQQLPHEFVKRIRAAEKAEDEWREPLLLARAAWETGDYLKAVTLLGGERSEGDFIPNRAVAKTSFDTLKENCGCLNQRRRELPPFTCWM